MHEHTVLFVDDEVNILKAIQRLLRHEPMNVLTASRPQEALEMLERSEAQLVVSDQRMPDMCGVDLLSTVRDRHSDVVRMMLTGYTEMNIAVEAINRGEIYRLITKPWNDEELKATLRQDVPRASRRGSAGDRSRRSRVTWRQRSRSGCRPTQSRTLDTSKDVADRPWHRATVGRNDQNGERR